MEARSSASVSASFAVSEDALVLASNTWHHKREGKGMEGAHKGGRGAQPKDLSKIREARADPSFGGELLVVEAAKVHDILRSYLQVGTFLRPTSWW